MNLQVDPEALPAPVTLRRPVMRYHGAKFRLAPRIIAHFPKHRRYVEPYGGGAGVLLRKSRDGVAGEIYNDLDEEVVNVFRVLRDPATAALLKLQCELTPFSRKEFNLSYEPHLEDAVERARRTIARSFMAYGTTHRRASRTGFRASQIQRNSTSATDWASWPDQIATYVERLRGVVIECRPAIECIRPAGLARHAVLLRPALSALDQDVAARPRPQGRRLRLRNDRRRSPAARGHAARDLRHGDRVQLRLRPLRQGAVPGLEAGEAADGAKKRIEVLWISPAARRGRK